MGDAGATMDWKTTLTLGVTLLVAVIGVVAKYLNDIAMARRKDRLDRINQQLKLLYGPLFALTSACDVTARAFRKEYKRTIVDLGDPNPLTSEGLVAWRTWMREVLMPLNLRIEKALVENADLLIENQMPPSLMRLVAHIESYKAVIKQWELGDYTRHTSLVPYPRGEVLGYAKRAFTALKTEQAVLCGSELNPAMKRPRRRPHRRESLAQRHKANGTS